MNYLEQFDLAVENYKRADQADPTLNSQGVIANIVERVRVIHNAIINKVKSTNRNSILIIFK